MPATLIDRDLRLRKTWVGKGTHGDTHRRLLVTLFGVEHRCPAHRTESEPEPGALVADAHVFGGSAANLIRCREAGQRCENTAGPALTGEAVANADVERFTMNLDAQLAAATISGTRPHSAALHHQPGRPLADSVRPPCGAPSVEIQVDAELTEPRDFTAGPRIGHAMDHAQR